jgi:hypothetical protein
MRSVDTDGLDDMSRVAKDELEVVCSLEAENWDGPCRIAIRFVVSVSDARVRHRRVGAEDDEDSYVRR